MTTDKQLSPEDARQKWEKELHERMQAARKKDARRYTAAQVLAAIIGSPNFDNKTPMQVLAKQSVAVADALLKELGE